ncbi:MAG: rod-binding protein [Candidatus Hydrogenedentes bacterium]|nr:rod-binding protein [Candidatus Hydrogenedentota bacterium]
MLLYVNPLSGPHAAQPEVSGSGAGSDRERTALKELEHYFAFTLLQEMRKSVPKAGLLDGGQAQQIYEEMLDDALSGSMAASGQLGVSRMLEQQLRLAELQKKIHKSAEAPGAGALLVKTTGTE